MKKILIALFIISNITHAANNCNEDIESLLGNVHKEMLFFMRDAMPQIIVDIERKQNEQMSDELMQVIFISSVVVATEKEEILKARLINMYKKEFTCDEIKKIRFFLESSAGAKYSSKQREIAESHDKIYGNWLNTDVLPNFKMHTKE